MRKSPETVVAALFRNLSLFSFLCVIGCNSNDLSPNPQGIAPSAAESDRINPDGKLSRALVFTGGGFQTAVFIGILDGLQSQGWSPDVIVSTCGSSLANAIINAFPDASKRKRFLESQAFHQILLTAKMNESEGAPLLKNFAAMLTGSLSTDLSTSTENALFDFSSFSIPQLFQGALMSVPSDFGSSELNKPFETSGIRSVMTGARLYFGPVSQGKPIQRYDRIYQEVFLTDILTGAMLKRFQSPLAKGLNHVMSPTDTLTQVSLSQAARISISDPYYMEPVMPQNDGYYYIGGSIDLYPLEAAHQLADEVIMSFSGEFDIVEQAAIATSFGYNNNQRVREVHDQSAEHWVDISDSSDVYHRYGMNPTPSLSRSHLVEVPFGVPEYHEFVRRVRALYDYGFERGAEAATTPVNGKCHARFMSKNNTSEELRQQCGR